MYTDWTAEESSSTPSARQSNQQHQSGETPADVRSNHDLFEGDLFGDEIMDGIYEAHDEDAEYITHFLHNEGERSHAIAKGVASGDQKATDSDGFGAFRPSTSFNDLSTLLPPDSDKKGANSDKKRKNPNFDAASRKKTTPARGSPRKGPTRGATTPVTPTRNIRAPKLAPLDGANMEVGTSSENGEMPITERLSVVAPVVDRATVKAVAKPPSSANGNGVSRDKTNFKSLAQAAVSSLISSAKTEEPTVSGAFSSKIDTSTAHVKALTGNNWVTASASVSASIPPSTSTAVGVSHDLKANADRAKARQTLTADDRAQQNRDRNREHARNTRLRKKAYVDELKRTLVEIVNQRDLSEAQKKQAAQRDLEQREVRFRVSEEFLKLRGRNEPSFARWSAILEEEFSLALPVTSYRGMVAVDSSAVQQELVGATAVMSDASHLSDFLQTLQSDASGTVTLRYRCDRKDFFMDGCSAVVEWEAVPCVGDEAISPSMIFRGNFRAEFSPASNKLVSAKLAFDTGSIYTLTNRDIFQNLRDASTDAVNQAHAILDSLEMPHVATSATLVPTTSSGSEASYKSEDSSDESCPRVHGSETADKLDAGQGAAPRRSQRLST